MYREEICLKATIHAKFKNIYQARKPKAKTVMMWILQKLLRQLQYSSILRIQVVTLRIIGGCLGIISKSIRNRIMGKILGIISSSLVSDAIYDNSILE